jgi:hypothetical protein
MSLSIPDSSDVRDTFGTVIDTVVEQNDELGRLNSHLDKVVRENEVARNKLIAATSQRLQHLFEHQLRLESQLQSAQQEIKNFAYNIQGYVDEHNEPSTTSESYIKVREITIQVEDIANDDESVGGGKCAPYKCWLRVSLTRCSIVNSSSSSIVSYRSWCSS